MTADIVDLADHRPTAPGIESEKVDTWLRQVLARSGHSADRLARIAGCSPTTVTRFLRHGYPIPKLGTLTKLAQAAGLPPPDLLVSDTQPFVDVPIVLPILAVTRGLREAILHSVQTTRAPQKFRHCIGVKITADTGSAAGVLLGDLVLCDPHQKPRDNDLVVLALDTGLAGVYRLQGDWLVAPGGGNHPSHPLAGAFILGVARQVQRELR